MLAVTYPLEKNNKMGHSKKYFFKFNLKKFLLTERRSRSFCRPFLRLRPRRPRQPRFIRQRARGCSRGRPPTDRPSIAQPRRQSDPQTSSRISFQQFKLSDLSGPE
jgi:hypothetical protein